MRYVLARPRLLSLTPSARSHHTRPQPARSHWTPFLSPYFPPALHVLTMRASPLLRRAAALECIAGRNSSWASPALAARGALGTVPGSPTAMLFAICILCCQCVLRCRLCRGTPIPVDELGG